MQGGVILFRGTGAAACRYLESDRSRADDYYLEGGTALAAFTVTDGSGEVLATSELDAEAYAGWVDWIDPLTETSMGKPRLPGEEGTAKHGSPRFAEMVVNTPKSLSVAAALHPDVSDTLDAAQAPGPVVTSRMVAAAWARDRPPKRPTSLAHEDGWRRELADAGYDPELFSSPE
jgi:hypothetical protein